MAYNPNPKDLSFVSLDVHYLLDIQNEYYYVNPRRIRIFFDVLHRVEPKRSRAGITPMADAAPMP